MSKARDLADSAQEINILDGKSFLDEDNLASDSATGIASQQSIKAYVDGITTTNITSTGALNSGSITSGFGNINNGSSTITTTGAITGGSFVIGSADINENDLESIDGITAGTVSASKAVVVNTNKDITGFRNITATGTISGSLSGTLSGAIASTTTATTQAESDDSTKVATTAYVTDKITTLIGGAPSTLNDLNELAAAINDDANYNSTLTTALGTKLPKSGGTMTGDVLYNDNVKAKFGAGSDLQIYHDGSNSYIQDQGLSGTGNLILAGADVEITTYGGDKYFSGSSNIARLYHTNNEKLATTSTGIDVTGTATATADFKAHSSSSGDYVRMYGGSGTGKWDIYGNGANLRFSDNENAGSVQFDTNVGIGTSSPQAELHVHDPAGLAKIRLSGTASDADTFEIAQGTTGVTNGGLTIRDVEASADRLVINSSGNVGIGTSSPSRQLHLSSSTPIIRLTDTDTNAYGEISSSSSDGNLMFFADQGNTQANTTIRFYVDTTERMRIDASGNVGIGTSSPNSYAGQTTLNINSTGVARLDLDINNSVQGYLLAESGYTGLFSHGSSSHLRLGTNSTERMRINHLGRQAYNGSATANGHANFVGEVGTSYKALAFEHTVGGGEVGSIRTTSSTAVYYGDGSNLTGVGGSTTAGAVGTYAWAAFNTAGTGGIIDFGDTKAGSTLYPVSVGYDGHTGNTVASSFLGGNYGALSGTWRFLSDAKSPPYNRNPAGLWLRIS